DPDEAGNEIDPGRPAHCLAARISGERFVPLDRHYVRLAEADRFRSGQRDQARSHPAAEGGQRGERHCVRAWRILHRRQAREFNRGPKRESLSETVVLSWKPRIRSRIFLQKEPLYAPALWSQLNMIAPTIQFGLETEIGISSDVEGEVD